MPETAFPIVGLGFSESGAAALSEVFSHLACPHGHGLRSCFACRHQPLYFFRARENSSQESSRSYEIAAGPDLSHSAWRARLNPRRRPANFPSWPRTPSVHTPRPMDHFFRSLAADRRNHAVAVVLSGDTLDGVQGCAAIQSAGGITLASRSVSLGTFRTAAHRHRSPGALTSSCLPANSRSSSPNSAPTSRAVPPYRTSSAIITSFSPACRKPPESISAITPKPRSNAASLAA